MDHEHSGPSPFWRSPAALTLLVAAAVGGLTPRFIPRFSKTGRARPAGSR